MRSKEFIDYLLHRFQLIPLSLLVLSDVLVIARIADLDSDNVLRQAAVFAMVICYLFSNRVGDDRRDFAFDQQFHPDRALQQGRLDLRTLERLGFVALGAMLLVAFVFGTIALILVLPVWFFSLWAKYDFSLSQSFKTRYFFVYNFLNMLQMLVLQVFIYCALLDSFDLNLTMWIHIAFVFVLSLQVEVTRKVKAHPTAGRDQYSDHMGIGGATILWTALGIISLLIFGWLGSIFGISNGLVWISLGFFFLLMLVTGFVYWRKSSERYENLFWLGMIGSYVGQNMVLAYG